MSARGEVEGRRMGKRVMRGGEVRGETERNREGEREGVRGDGGGRVCERNV